MVAIFTNVQYVYFTPLAGDTFNECKICSKPIESVDRNQFDGVCSENFQFIKISRKRIFNIIPTVYFIVVCSLKEKIRKHYSSENRATKGITTQRKIK